MIEVNKVNDYSLLKENEGIQGLIVEISDLQKEVNGKKANLSILVMQVQQSCPHKNFIEERSKNNAFGCSCKTLLSKTCVDCGNKQHKPEGSTWVVCPNCWGKMEHVATIPGQGDREQVYECETCRTEHRHT